MTKWTFTAEKGYFDDLVAAAAKCPNKRLTTQPNLSLTERSYPSDADNAQDKRQWVRFTEHIKALNRDSPDNVSYKLLYLTRHGEGYHNKKAAEVGEEEWDNHWSLLEGDGKTTWFDPFLTPEGITQANALSAFWTILFTKSGAPLPQSLYSSPLTRCLQTSQYVFKPIMQAHNLPYAPTIKEDLREHFTLHTCDMRRPRSWIAQNWSEYVIEDGFSEEDVLGKLGRWETDEEHVERKTRALRDVFEQDEESNVVCWTVHSMAIQAIFMALGEPKFLMKEATSLAVLVKGVREE